MQQVCGNSGDERPEHHFLRVKGGFLSGQLEYDGALSPRLTIRHHKVEGQVVSEFPFDGSGAVHQE